MRGPGLYLGFLLVLVSLAGCAGPEPAPETPPVEDDTVESSPTPDAMDNETMPEVQVEPVAPNASAYVSNQTGPLAARIGFTVSEPCTVSLALSGALAEGTSMFSAMDLSYLPTMVVQHDGASTAVGPVVVAEEGFAEGTWYAQQTFPVPEALIGEELFWVFGVQDLSPSFMDHSVELFANCGAGLTVTGVRSTTTFAIHTLGELSTGVRHEMSEPDLQMAVGGTTSFAPPSGSALVRLAVAERGDADLLSLVHQSDDGIDTWYHDGFSGSLFQTTLAGPSDFVVTGTNTGKVPVVLFLMEECPPAPWQDAFVGTTCT